MKCIVAGFGNKIVGCYKEKTMKIPESLTETGGSQEFRHEWMLITAYKIIDLEAEEENHREIIDARFYIPKKNSSLNMKCIIWIRDAKNNRYAWALGKTYGAGYHQQSEVTSDALRKMGIEFERQEDPASKGSDALEETLS